MPTRHPILQGLLAVALGGVLALLLVVGVRAVQQDAARSSVPERSDVPASPADACLLRERSDSAPSEPDPMPGPDYPRQEHQLDTGRPITVDGTGNAEIAYERLGDFATVVDFNCANCDGPLRVFNTGAALPIVDGLAAGERFETQWLIDTVHDASDGPHNSLLIAAEGDWTLTLRSWHDLPVDTGSVEAQGARVVRVPSGTVRVTFEPLNSRDTLNVYAYRLADRGYAANLCVGRFESRTLDLNGGEVLLIWARGEWTLEVI